MKRKTMFLAAMALSVFAGAAAAAVIGVDLGTVAPPTSVGPFNLSAFSQTPQTAIADGSTVASVPGGPGGTSLGLSPSMVKQTVGAGWATWSHGYTGAVYTNITAPGATETIALPPLTHAVYLYVEPNNFAAFNVTAFPGFGAPITISVVGNAGANGFAFYSTAGEVIQRVEVSVDPAGGGYAIGEFGLTTADLSVPALEPGMLAALAVLLLGAGIWMQRRRKA